MLNSYELFIDGEWRPKETAETIDVLSPSTGEVIGRVSNATARDPTTAVYAACAAVPGWAATAPRERAEILRACFEVMTTNREEIAHLISSETASRWLTRGGGRLRGRVFRWYAEEAVRIIGHVGIAPSGNNRILVQHQPIGVSVLVTPWNFPAAMATRKIAPALATGCSVVSSRRARRR